MDALDALQLRDQEINKALSLANEILNEEPKQNENIEKDTTQSDEDMDTLIELVKSVDVEPASNLGKLVDLDDRTQFAANLDEIKSRIDLNDYNEHAQINVDQRVPAEGRERFLKARVTVLEEEVKKLTKELQKTGDKLHKAKREAQTNGESTEFLTKQNEKLKKDLIKSKNAATDASKEKEEAQRELKLIRRELDDLKRAKKTVKPKQQQNDVRLQRALEEAQKYKLEMAEMTRKHKDDGVVAKAQYNEATAETARQKKLVSEYKSVIQKQSKLIEVLRNKCTHLEAARVLDFSEQEFMRVLDWK
ncbi:Oidioi.mRNA.OKI2018_I69.XSR.g14793.t1.cds [Oikopleura dioica]|uniref:Oidioi.mRNA.OKI2018_I69.XSR.g14793.t1.cds n=1 Tax=Oikopleura dioica TaxID=34765 RepID=A0ABN7SBC7_OIKDI|nr:Oidioi.mRNA.OKI2018_I69.XSR.g14793.t1.cds [Oikopleura dioica]